MPLPGGGDDGAQVIVLGLPAQHLHRLLRGGDELGGIAGPAGRDLRGDGVAGDAPGHVDDLLHREAHAVAQVEDIVLATLEQIVQGQDVGLGQVGNMDVVPDAGAVGGGVVVPEDAHVVPLAVGYLEDNGDQMGLGVVGLADGAGDVGAGGVEVPQSHILEAVGLGHPAHHLLHGQLGVAVAVGGHGLVALQDGHPLRLPVGGGGGGEDDLVHPVLHHGLQEHHGAVEVVVIVLQRVGHALPHLGGGGEVDHALDVLRLEQGVQRPLVPDVQLIEPGLGVDRLPEAGEEVVRHHHVPARVDELVHRVGADVAGSAQH